MLSVLSSSLLGDSSKYGGRKLMTELEQLPVDKRPVITRSATSMYETTWASLSLRINQPYWLLHQGNCEHYVVIDEIRSVVQSLRAFSVNYSLSRSRHPSDPPLGYPLTIQITPPLLSLCRACNKVPAVWSIVGDMRLGESPCVLCEPCWQCMGPPPSGGDEVVAVPLPRHELGW
jgi:snRNA-activating protein complex subunit 3